MLINELKYFGFDSFRPKKKLFRRCLMEKILAILPTGTGKAFAIN